MDRVTSFFEHGYVQTGAGYPAADIADKVTHEAKTFANILMNGEGIGGTLIGPSTTSLLHRLSDSMAHGIKPGDEIVVSVANHEANIGPWLKLEAHGAKIVWWGIDPKTGLSSLDDLTKCVNQRTKIVAFAHTSNLVGDIADAKAIATIARSVGAKVVADGVAFAPHQAIDVAAWGVDYYAISCYKVYGPHIGLLYGRADAWAGLRGPNHYFIPENSFPWKFELGCQPYELLAGLLGTRDYLVALAPEQTDARFQVTAAFQTIRQNELPAQKAIQDFLAQRDDLRLIGANAGDERHPTFSFVHDRLSSDVVARRVNAQGVGIRCGHMYAKRLCEALGVAPEPGVVRVSAVHYNGEEDTNRLLAALKSALDV